MALLRICNYLRINTQKAFSIWRKATLQRNMLKNLQIVLGNKRYRDQYQAFTCLNNRAFTIFRQEIKAKIEDCETRKD